MKPDERICSLCLNWKRKGAISGFCWHPLKEQTPWPVNERDTCQDFAPKVLVVTAEGQ